MSEMVVKDQPRLIRMDDIRIEREYIIDGVTLSQVDTRTLPTSSNWVLVKEKGVAVIDPSLAPLLDSLVELSQEEKEALRLEGLKALEQGEKDEVDAFADPNQEA